MDEMNREQNEMNENEVNSEQTAVVTEPDVTEPLNQPEVVEGEVVETVNQPKAVEGEVVETVNQSETVEGKSEETVNQSEVVENRNEQITSQNQNQNRDNGYVFWAESGNRMNQQGPVRYSAPDYRSNFQQGPVNYGATTPAGNRQKKKDSFGKKFAKLVGSAAVFGLVAGLVFQGVNYTAKRFMPEKSQATVQQTVTQVPGAVASTTISNGTNSSTDLTALVENTMPSIVSITSTMTQDFSYFGQVYSQEYDGSGSGIIVGQNEKEILIVTNNHVVDGATAIAVNFIDDTVHEAKIKGTDSTADLAVVAVKISDISEETMNEIKVASLGDSESVKVGQMAVAIGNALGSGQSVTVGYISAKNRQVNTSSSSQGSQLELLQTDAAINPGNSGGALLNINGEVIGINDMKYADTDVEGMGYAIPISEAIPIINELMNREILNEDEKGYLGISGSSITSDNNYYDMPVGVYVSQVAQGSAAEEGGMKKGDIITKINGVNTQTIEAVQEKVNNIRVGTEITVTVMRNSEGEYKEIELKVTLKGKETLDKLNNTAEDNTPKGNFGYKKNDDNLPNEGTQPAQPGDNTAPEDNGDFGENDDFSQDINPYSEFEQEFNDIFDEFFNFN